MTKPTKRGGRRWQVNAMLASGPVVRVVEASTAEQAREQVREEYGSAIRKITKTRQAR